jgi:hypothetical protein
MLLIVLSHYGFLRLITVLVPEQRLLLLLSGIAIPRILTLVNRQWSACLSRVAIPLVPSLSMLLPVLAPALALTWRRIALPPRPSCGRMAIVAHGYPKDERRHGLWTHQPPGPVVPGARVPAIPLVNPVRTIVEEQVKSFRGVVTG